MKNKTTFGRSTTVWFFQNVTCRQEVRSPSRLPQPVKFFIIYNFPVTFVDGLGQPLAKLSFDIFGELRDTFFVMTCVSVDTGCSLQEGPQL